MTATVSSSTNSPLSFSGLASGLNTSEIISSLLSVEREPVARMTNEQTKLEGQRTQLLSIQNGLSQLSVSAQELGSVVLFKDAQGVTSSNPTLVAASTSAGAAIGGYELEVTQLASSGQRTFTFHSPSEADQVTIDGQSFEVAAGASAQTLANAINASSSATVYAAVTNGETIVLSTRATGASGPSYIQVGDAGGTLTEQAALAKEGRNAQYSLDGVAGSSASNTLTSAIPGVTLNLKAVTRSTPVTIDVQPPAPNTSAIVEQVKSFVTLYNSTIAAMQKQLTTKPPQSPATVAELQSGTLFGDPELIGVLDGMRQSIYEPLSGAPSELPSLAQIGISTGAASGSGTVSQSAVEGQLQINTEQLEAQLTANPAGVQQLLQTWSSAFRGVVDPQALPGGDLEARTTGDAEQIAGLGSRMTALNEMIALRQKTLQQQFAAMEAAVSRSESQGSFISAQLSSLSSSSSSSSSSSARHQPVGRRRPLRALDTPRSTLAAPDRLPGGPGRERGRPSAMTPPTATTHAYRENTILAAAPEQLVVMLYDGAQRFLRRAGVAMGAREIERSAQRDPPRRTDHRPPRRRARLRPRPPARVAPAHDLPLLPHARAASAHGAGPREAARGRAAAGRAARVLGPDRQRRRAWLRRLAAPSRRRRRAAHRARRAPIPTSRSSSSPSTSSRSRARAGSSSSARSPASGSS